MALRKRDGNEKGYTLLETLVAMAIFTSVMIPLVGTIGNFLLDRRSEKMQNALQRAETEISRTVLENNYVDGTIEDPESGFIGRREIIPSTDTQDITISVTSNKDPKTILVVLHKTVFFYPE